MTQAKDESLERLAPSIVQSHLMITDRDGAGYTTCHSWHVAYALRAAYEEQNPGRQFCIRHTDCLIY